MEDKMTEISHAQKKWRSLLKDFYASNQSARHWCQQNDVSYQSFLHWKKRIESKNEEKFIELKPEEPVELTWKGIKIYFTRIEDLKCLKSLLEALC